MTVGVSKRALPWMPDLSLMFSNMDLTKNIQRVNLRVKSQYGEIESGLNDYEFLNLFSGSEIARKTCTVTMIVYPSTRNFVRIWILRKMQPLTGFNKVVLEICIDWIWEPLPASFGDAALHMIRYRIYFGVRLARKMLVPTLGPGKLVLGEDGKDVKNRSLCLRFYPRHYQQSIQKVSR